MRSTMVYTGVVHTPMEYHTMNTNRMQLLALSALRRCLKSAQRRGVDPYNSHLTQARCFERAWQDKARRSQEPQT